MGFVVLKIDDYQTKKAKIKELKDEQPPHPDAEKKAKEREAKRLRRRDRAQRFLLWWSVQATRVVGVVAIPFRVIGAGIDRIDRFLERHPKVVFGIRIFAVIGVGLFALTVIGVAGYWLYQLILITPWKIIGLGLALGLGTVALAFVIIYLGSREPVLAGVTHTANFTKSRVVGFKGAMGIGYHAVKDRTCPIIEVIDE